MSTLVEKVDLATHTAPPTDLSFIAKHAPNKRILVYFLLYILVIGCLPQAGVSNQTHASNCGEGSSACPSHSSAGLVGGEEGRIGLSRLWGMPVFLQGCPALRLAVSSSELLLGTYHHPLWESGNMELKRLQSSSAAQHPFSCYREENCSLEK